MDKTSVCGTDAPGSTPGESTNATKTICTAAGRFAFVSRMHVLTITNVKTAEAGEEALSRIGAQRTIILSDLTPGKLKTIPFSYGKTPTKTLCIQSVARVEADLRYL